MPLSIKNVEAEKLARQVSKETGESVTQAIIHSLEDRLQKIRGKKTAPDLIESLTAISKRCQNLPDQDTRRPEDILGYNTSGTFE